MKVEKRRRGRTRKKKKKKLSKSTEVFLYVQEANCGGRRRSSRSSLSCSMQSMRLDFPRVFLQTPQVFVRVVPTVVYPPYVPPHLRTIYMGS